MVVYGANHHAVQLGKTSLPRPYVTNKYAKKLCKVRLANLLPSVTTGVRRLRVWRQVPGDGLGTPQAAGRGAPARPQQRHQQARRYLEDARSDEIRTRERRQQVRILLRIVL